MTRLYWWSNSNPKKVLDEIKDILELYRDTLEKNFSVSDILVEVGKNQYSKNKKKQKREL